MTSQSKSLLALAAAAALLSGCVAGPYPYGSYAYNDPNYYGNGSYDPYYDRPAPAPAPYGYYYGPTYYPRYYAAPSIGFGFSYSNRGYHH